MATWKDNSGTSWNWQIDPPTLKTIQRELPEADILGMLSLTDRGPWDALGANPIMVYDLAWILSREQAEERGVSEEAFGKAFVGDAFSRAEIALIETLADFSPTGKKSFLRRLARQVTTASEESLKRLNARLDELDANGWETLYAPATSSPVSSESTPAG